MWIPKVREFFSILVSKSAEVCSNLGSKIPQNNSAWLLKLGSNLSVMSKLRSLNGFVY